MSRLARLGSAVVAATLTAAAVVSVPSSARAADPEVCATRIGPTPATQPWYDFAHTPNALWGVRNRLVATIATIDAAAAKLGPSSTPEEVDSVRRALLDGVGNWLYTFKAYDTDNRSTMELLDLVAALRLVSPESADAAQTQVIDAYVATVMPVLTPLVSSDGTLQSFIDTYEDRLTASSPLSGPVAIPSAAAAIAGVTATARAFDTWHALGNAHVVLGSAPMTTCVSTAALTVPGATTTFGKATTVTINATRDGVATRGDFAVLLDGEQIGSATQESSYVASVPASTAVGPHLLTVAFAPVDGSPLSTGSSTITVTKVPTASALKLSKAKVKAGTRVTATVTVAVPGTTTKATGTATIKVGKRTVEAKIRGGKGTVSLGRLAAGRYRLVARYTGTSSLGASTSPKAVLTVRR